MGMRKEGLLLALDLVVLVLVVPGAMALRYGLGVPEEHVLAFLAWLPVLLPWRLFTAYAFGLYDFRRNLTYADRFLAALGAAFAGVLPGYLVLALAQLYYSYITQFSRVVIAFDLCFCLVWLFASRGIVLAMLRRRGHRVHVLLVGGVEDCSALSAEIEANAPWYVAVSGQFAPPEAGAPRPAWPGLLDAVRAGKADEVVLATPELAQFALHDLASLCDDARIPLYLHPHLGLPLLASAEVTGLAGVPLVPLHPRFQNSPYRFGKRLLDVVVAGAGLLVLLPVMLMAALGVLLTSGRPLFFSQERAGRDRRPFRIHKLRTMVAGAENLSGPALAQPGDPRVTAFGHWLRKSRIDEIPQFWNVLRGDMSLVGPRPERPAFVEAFLAENPLYERRFLVRPGLTGLAQIHGGYDTDYTQKLRYDLIYINSLSLAADLRVLVATVRTVLTGAGAV